MHILIFHLLDQLLYESLYFAIQAAKHIYNTDKYRQKNIVYCNFSYGSKRALQKILGHKKWGLSSKLAPTCKSGGLALPKFSRMLRHPHAQWPVGAKTADTASGVLGWASEQEEVEGATKAIVDARITLVALACPSDGDKAVGRKRRPYICHQRAVKKSHLHCRMQQF